MAGRTYIAIDLKSYYASAECADRHLDPLSTNLVVADSSRTEKTICLAVSPSLKALGIPGRPRLFEVVQKVREINTERLNAAIRNKTARYKDGQPSLGPASFDARLLKTDPSLEVSYLVAVPRMRYYMEVSAKIYNIYLKYVAPEDIVVYSIDEVFIDATPYLSTYRMSAHELAMSMIREVLYSTGITATAGISKNLYLAKIAMDIVAKHVPADKDGVRIGELDEISYRKLLWDHHPLTSFWMIGHGTAEKLERHGIYTMGDIARASLSDQEWFYKVFGIDAELLIDHAWGIEPCGIREIKSYQPNETSISEGQVLSCPYPYRQARIIVQEMTDSLIYQLVEKEMVAGGLTLHINYDRENVKSYMGPTVTDHYGRKVPKPAHGTVKLDPPTNLGSKLMEGILNLYDNITDPKLTIRKINITAIRVVPDDGCYQVDLFTDTSSIDKEKRLQKAMLSIKQKFGKNAVLKGMSLEEGATMRERNQQVGGHRE